MTIPDATKSKISPPKLRASAALAADLRNAESTLATATAAFDSLIAGESDAARGGADRLRAHRARIEAATIDRDAAAAAVAAIGAELRAAQDNEEAASLEARRAAVATDYECVVADILALAPNIKKQIASVLARARRVSATIRTVNAALTEAERLHTIEHEPRLAAGTLTEQAGIFLTRRDITIFDSNFWMPAIPGESPAPSAAKPVPAAAPAVAARATAAPQFLQLPRDDTPSADEGRPFTPGKFVTLPRAGA